MFDNVINDKILKAIDIVVQQRLKETIPIDYYEGMVKQVNKNGTYEVESAGATFTVYAMNNDTYDRGDVVIVLMFGTYRYILTKKSSIII
jgi:hypothetical protein